MALRRFLAFLFFLISIPLFSQDSHYWTAKYGAESTLLGGAVVGSNLDISSTFYNPGALGITKNPAIVITGWEFNITSINFQSAAGQNKDAAAFRFSPAPDYFTGLIPIESAKSKLAYTFLTRTKFHERFFVQDSFEKDVLERPGNELFFGDYYIDQSMLENWFGLCWSRAISPRIGIGITNFIAYRSQKFRSNIQNKALTSTNTAALSSSTQQFNYFNYHLLWKIGLAADFSPLKLGITVTTPSINIFGQGSAYISRASIGLSIPELEGQDLVEFNNQSNMTSRYLTPLSVAIGGSYDFHKTTVHVSAEWFNSTGEVRVLPTTMFESQTTGALIDNPVVQDFKSVTNFGVGIEQKYSQYVELYGSVVTDFSAAKPESKSTISVTSWPIYHVMVGALFRLWRSEITAGVGYSFGENDVLQKANFDSAHESNLLLGELEKEKAVYRNFKILIGFSIFPNELFKNALDELPFFKKKNTD